MTKIRIVTDSVCDVSPSILAQHNIVSIPCSVNMDGVSLPDDGVSFDRKTFYQRIPHLKTFPTTAAPSPLLAETMLKDALEGYDHLIGVHVPAHLSATLNNIRLGAQAFPADKITLVDSGTLSMGIGMQALIAAEVAEKTGDVGQVLAAIERVRQHQQLYAAFYTLDYLRRSGRVNPLLSGIGTLLQIKPIVSAHDGKLEPIARIRTFPKALDYLYDLVKAQAPLDRLVILHIQNEQGARDFLARLGGLAPAHTPLVEVGPTLGAHIGAGSIGVVTLSQAWKNA